MPKNKKTKKPNRFLEAIEAYKRETGCTDLFSVREAIQWALNNKELVFSSAQLLDIACEKAASSLRSVKCTIGGVKDVRRWWSAHLEEAETGRQGVFWADLYDKPDVDFLIKSVSQDEEGCLRDLQALRCKMMYLNERLQEADRPRYQSRLPFPDDLEDDEGFAEAGA